MTRRSWIPSLILGLTAGGLSGCMPRYAGLSEDAHRERNAAAVDKSAGAPPSCRAEPPPHADRVQPAHFPDAAPPPGPAPSVIPNDPPPAVLPPPPRDVPVVQ